MERLNPSRDELPSSWFEYSVVNRIDSLIEVIWPFHPGLSSGSYEIELFRGFTGQLKSRSQLSVSLAFSLIPIHLGFIPSSLQWRQFISCCEKNMLQSLASARWKIPLPNNPLYFVLCLFCTPLNIYLFQTLLTREYEGMSDKQLAYFFHG